MNVGALITIDIHYVTIETDIRNEKKGQFHESVRLLANNSSFFYLENILFIFVCSESVIIATNLA